MTTDVYQAGLEADAHVALSVALTTGVCREAQRVHQLEATSAIALGRLLTATAMVAHSMRNFDMASLQVLCWGRVGQIFADINRDGQLRGYIKNPFMDLPLLENEQRTGRRSIARGIGGGTLSVIRAEGGQGFSQGTTDLIGCEVDSDVQQFLERSDQQPTTLVCDVLFDADGKLERAAGAVLQAMPDADMERYETIRRRLLDGHFADVLLTNQDGSKGLLQAIDPNVRPAGHAVPLQFKCRCSYERVVGALRMLGPQQLAEMVDLGEEPAVSCEFCGTQYTVAKHDVQKVFEDTIIARG